MDPPNFEYILYFSAPAIGSCNLVSGHTIAKYFTLGVSFNVLLKNWQGYYIDNSKELISQYELPVKENEIKHTVGALITYYLDF